MSLTKLGNTSTTYNFPAPDANILEFFHNKSGNIVVPFLCGEFTAICPVTGQPDFAKIEIVYIPNKKCVESKSLKLYLFSFRNHGEFHEEVIARIGKDLCVLLEPKFLRVFGNFRVRGGIAITPMFSFFDSKIAKKESDALDRQIWHYDRIRVFDVI